MSAMSECEPPIVEVFAILGEIMDAFRRTTIFVGRLGTFDAVTLHATPSSKLASETSSASVCFFLDAEIPEATTRAQISLGVSLRIYSQDQTWIAEPDISWQVTDKPGSAFAVSWDSRDLTSLSETVTRTFFEVLPSYALSLLDDYKAAIEEYLLAVSGTEH